MAAAGHNVLSIPNHLMIGVSFALLLLGLDGRIGRLDGLLLFVGPPA